MTKRTYERIDNHCTKCGVEITAYGMCSYDCPDDTLRISQRDKIERRAWKVTEELIKEGA